MNEAAFRELLWEKARELYRTMPWRENTEPYYVLVSEIMLQQTQVDRVRPKFEAFIESFPTIESLAAAPLAEVLRLWTGLGYNRRAKFLHEAAKKIVNDFDGVFPKTSAELVTLPGVGKNTAGAILAYSFNEPVIFIETNVRTVYFYHFFHEQDVVHDTELSTIIEATIDHEHPREWYWAIMDYGSYLKKQGVGNIKKSQHYKKQSALKGSVREIRGQIIKQLTRRDMSRLELAEHVVVDERFEGALTGLIRDGLVSETDDQLHLAR